MKHLIITVILVITTQITFSQNYYLGLTEKEAIKQIAKEPYNEYPTRLVLKNGKIALGWTNLYFPGMYILYFDSKKISETYTVVPQDMKLLSGYINYFNENYVIISKNYWQVYNSGKIIDIEVKFVEEDKQYGIYFTFD